MSAGELERVADYLSGALSDEEAAGFEEQLFAGGGGLADEALFLDRFSRIARWLAARGTLAAGIRKQEAEALLRSGRRVAYLDIGDSRDVDWTLPADCEQFLYRIGLDLRGVDRLDSELILPNGISKVFPDIQFDAEDGALFAVCEAPLARLAFGYGPCVARFIAGGRGERNGEIARLNVHIRVQ